MVMASVKDIKRQSICCKDGMLVTDIDETNLEKLSIPNTRKCVFCVNNGLLSFFDEKGKLYVTKCTKLAQIILENLNYKQEDFENPLGVGKIPFDKKLVKKLKTMLQ